MAEFEGDLQGAELEEDMQRAGLADKFRKKKEKPKAEKLVLPAKSTLEQLGPPDERHFSGKSLGIIINNNFRGKKGNELLAYDYDVVNIEETFGGVNVSFQTEKNLKAFEVVNNIRSWLKINQYEFEDADGVFCFILTHGCDKGILLGEDFHPFHLNDIRKLFIDCKALHGKPKMIFIQACRGSADSQAVLVDDESSVRTAGAKQKAKDADVFQFFPTAPGNVAWVSDDGSLFIKTLCDVVNAYGSKYSLQDIVTKVNGILASHIKTMREGNKMTTVCEASEATHSLTYNLYFNDAKKE